MSDYKIEKGIPDPLESKRGPKYPFHDMAIGDSFYLCRADKQRVASMACRMQRRHGMFFSTLPDGEGYRCWRIEPPAVSRPSGAGRKKAGVEQFNAKSAANHEASATVDIGEHRSVPVPPSAHKAILVTEPARSVEDITNDTLEALDDVLAQLRRTMRDIEANKEALRSATRTFTKWTIVSNIGSMLGSELPLGMPLLRLARNEADLANIDAGESVSRSQDSRAAGDSDNG